MGKKWVNAKEYYKKIKDSPEYKARRRRYYKKNKEREIKRVREWQKKNPEKRKEHSRKAVLKFRTEKRERFNELMRNNYHRNKGKQKSRTYTYQILLGIRTEKYELEKNCKICGTKTDLEIHHDIYPKGKDKIIKALKQGKIYYLCKEHHKH